MLNDQIDEIENEYDISFSARPADFTPENFNVDNEWLDDANDEKYLFDGETVVPITAYSCSGDSIDLTVAGNIDGNFTVSCGYGATPLPYLPFDRTSGLPLLCFHMVAIELNERL